MTERETIIIRVTEGGEFMVTYPGGCIRFMGFWEAMWTLYRSVRDKLNVELE